MKLNLVCPNSPFWWKQHVGWSRFTVYSVVCLWQGLSLLARPPSPDKMAPVVQCSAVQCSGRQVPLAVHRQTLRARVTRDALFSDHADVLPPLCLPGVEFQRDTRWSVMMVGWPPCYVQSGCADYCCSGRVGEGGRTTVYCSHYAERKGEGIGIFELPLAGVISALAEATVRPSFLQLVRVVDWSIGRLVGGGCARRWTKP